MPILQTMVSATEHICNNRDLFSGKPDEIVARKTEDVHKNGAEWYKKAVQVVNDPNRVDKPIVDSEAVKA